MAPAHCSQRHPSTPMPSATLQEGHRGGAEPTTSLASPRTPLHYHPETLTPQAPRKVPEALECPPTAPPLQGADGLGQSTQAEGASLPGPRATPEAPPEALDTIRPDDTRLRAGGGRRQALRECSVGSRSGGQGLLGRGEAGLQQEPFMAFQLSQTVGEQDATHTHRTQKPLGNQTPGLAQGTARGRPPPRTGARLAGTGLQRPPRPGGQRLPLGIPGGQGRCGGVGGQTS